jgi:UDP:flavonoid glycosyltransferase YjiC (YdhE family)
VGLGSIYSLITSELLQNIAAACVQSGLRCLIVGHASDAKFPEGVVAVRYAPYDALFPRAAVAVVHGGAGATGDALRSGRPVLAVPFAFDQFWMAAQIVRLGVGERIRVATRSADDFAAVLQRLVSDPALASRAAETARGFVAERDGAEIAADRIEALLASGRPEIAATAA